MPQPTQHATSLVDPIAVARTALACLDLTSLGDQDTDADIDRLCRRAQGPCGPVAAVCVWPRFAAHARRLLPPTIAVAGVANFPHGGTDVDAVLREVGVLVDAGAQEVDVVLPYRALRAGDTGACARLLRAVRRAAPGLALKVILETGELPTAATQQAAAALALTEGADWLKTSSGRTPVSATPAAAQLLLDTIMATPQACDRVGVKASGGIRTVADAGVYIGLARTAWGTVSPVRFRLGASALLDDIEAVWSAAGR